MPIWVSAFFVVDAKNQTDFNFTKANPMKNSSNFASSAPAWESEAGNYPAAQTNIRNFPEGKLPFSWAPRRECDIPWVNSRTVPEKA